MSRPGIVTFTTDFGEGDTFVSQMKGAALAVHPDLTLVDISHEVPAHDITAGAFLLRTAYAAFPPGTVHVAVVDPGVGTERRGIVVRTENYYFVAPDNGLLSLVFREEPVGNAYVLQASHYRRKPLSATFHGRDVFAPAAAWIVRGVGLENFGPPAGDLVELDIPRIRVEAGKPTPVDVLLVDRFGNVTLNVSRSALAGWLGPDASARIEIETPRGTISEIRETYGEGEGEGPFLLFNSAGHLEVALRAGRASDALDLAAGKQVVLTVHV